MTLNPQDYNLRVPPCLCENKRHNTSKRRIRLTEGSLKKMIKECINSVLNENYSARHYSNQISDITKKFLSFKDMVDRLGGYYRTWEGYGIKISLKPFFDKKSNIQPKYRRDKEYYIRINYDYQKSGNVVTGFYNPNKLHKTDFQIELTVPSQAQYDDIFYSIEHEVTHLIDDLIKESKGLHTHSFPTIQMENASLPKYARMLLYILWTNTEFNAWQANFRQMCGDKDFLEVMIKYLNDANNSYDENEWLNIQSFVSNKIKDNRLQQIRPLSFKNYFIKSSFKLLKKMVKKYY